MKCVPFVWFDSESLDTGESERYYYVTSTTIGQVNRGKLLKDKP